MVHASLPSPPCVTRCTCCALCFLSRWGGVRGGCVSHAVAWGLCVCGSGSCTCVFVGLVALATPCLPQRPWSMPPSRHPRVSPAARAVRCVCCLYFVQICPREYPECQLPRPCRFSQFRVLLTTSVLLRRACRNHMRQGRTESGESPSLQPRESVLSSQRMQVARTC